MINIISGIMAIPEDERFIGFVGDNLHTKRQFLVHNITDENCVYRMYLTFNDGTVNYFVLDSEVVDNSSTLLTWNILEEHIFKSGTVKAQIKAIAQDGEIYHTNTDFFLVGATAEYSDGFRNSDNSEFLEYEKRLNEILAQINSGELEVVTQDRKIAGNNLKKDISVKMLCDSLKTYPVIKLTDEPTKDTVGKLNQLAYSRTTQNGIDFINKLYVCYAIVGSKYMWDEISGGFSGTQSGNADLSNYATKAYVDSVIDSLKSDIAYEPEFD
ncbi:MAG: hypothetical protein IIX27_03700, partial [Ruminococcus sp.]|nr:hypothetical protein [Ruminococcus sp.]